MNSYGFLKGKLSGRESLYRVLGSYIEPLRALTGVQLVSGKGKARKRRKGEERKGEKRGKQSTSRQDKETKRKDNE